METKNTYVVNCTANITQHIVFPLTGGLWIYSCWSTAGTQTTKYNKIIQIQSSWLHSGGIPRSFLTVSHQGGVSCPRDKHTAWGRLCVFFLSLTFFGPLIYLFWWRSDLHAATLVQTASTKQYDLSRPPHNNSNLTRCEMSFLAVLSSFPAIFFMQSVKMNEWMGVSLTIYRQIWALRVDCDL